MARNVYHWLYCSRQFTKLGSEKPAGQQEKGVGGKRQGIQDNKDRMRIITKLYGMEKYIVK